ncbi:MAG: ABC transporter permease [Candidatus Ranarchaeia archaeon]
MFEKSWIMAKTEIRMVFKSRQVKSIPIILVTLSVGFSFLIAWLFSAISESAKEFSFFMSPILSLMIIVLPIMLPMMIAADSIVGEKERRTLLPLLKTPLTDSELIMGKLLTALIPGLAVSYSNFLIGVITLNLFLFLTNPSLLWIWPNLMAVLQGILYPPLFSGLAVCIMIMLSTKVDKVYEAYQTGGIIIIPAMFLAYSQFLPSVSLHWTFFILGLIIMIVANYICFRIARNIFNRNELMSRK